MDERELRARERRARRRRNDLIMKCIIALLIVILAVLVVILARELFTGDSSKTKKNQRETQLTTEEGGAILLQPEGLQEATESSAPADTETPAGSAGANTAGAVQGTDLLSQANRMAAMYDYDGAMELLKSADGYATNTEYQNAVAGYQATKDTCSAYPADQITHVFFHTLIWDTAKAFDGDGDSGGYNQVMTTMSEFQKIMQSMYDKGYVMVSVHDIAGVNEDGTMYAKEILLPPGKKAFVLSQDDVSYYHYMDGDGFAQKLIVDENGKVKNTYLEDDGSVSVGDYDMIPWIDTFVEEHPDFSYHGHKGIIALTGYEGVLGYRTDEVYKTREADRVTKYQQQFLDANPDFDFDAEVAEAKKVADAMKAAGWEFASHTWGHQNAEVKTAEELQTDDERFRSNVMPIIGETDVIIFAFGADIGGWEPYTMDNPKFAYYKNAGYNYFLQRGFQPVLGTDQ